MSNDEIEVLKDQAAGSKRNEGVYRFIIIILLTLLGGTCGYSVKSFQMEEKLIVNTIKVENLEKRFTEFDKKLDIILNRLPQR
jgi:hypothetical protein